MATYCLSAFADEAGSALSAQLEALRGNGIRFVEMRGVNGKSACDMTDGEARDVKSQLDAEGVALSSLGSPYGKYPIEQPFETHLDAFKRGLELCDLLGAKRIRMFSFFIPAGRDADEYRAEVLDRLDEMLSLAEKAGVALCHENEKGIYGDTDARCLDLADAFKGRLGVIFDPANFIQCGVNPKAAFPAFREKITYMHIKDALAGSGAVVPSGKGDGGLPAILDSLGDRAEGMFLTLEPHLTVFKGLSSLQAEEVKHEYSYPDARTAFDAAAGALKGVLTSIGFCEVDGGYGIWTR